MALSFYKLTKLIEKILKDFNLDKANALPIYLLEIKEGEPEKPIAILIGEQHQGDNYQGMSYSRTNRTLIDLLLVLYSNPELALGAAFKEGSSNISLNEDYQTYTKDDFATKYHHPLEAIKHLLRDKDIEIYPTEPSAAIIKFIIIAILYSSLIAESVIPPRENDRVIKILLKDQSESKIQLINSIINEVISELKLEPLIEQRIIIKASITSLYKLMNIELDPQYQELAAKIKIPRLYATLEAKNYPELNFLISKIRLKALQMAEEREKHITETVTKLGTSVHPILIGHKHLKNLSKMLNDKGFTTIVLSPFKEVFS